MTLCLTYWHWKNKIFISTNMYHSILALNKISYIEIRLHNNSLDKNKTVHQFLETRIGHLGNLINLMQNQGSNQLAFLNNSELVWDQRKMLNQHLKKVLKKWFNLNLNFLMLSKSNLYHFLSLREYVRLKKWTRQINTRKY